MQQVLEKLVIHQTKLLLSLNYTDTFNVLPGHSCGGCNLAMDENVVPAHQCKRISEFRLKKMA